MLPRERYNRAALTQSAAVMAAGSVATNSSHALNKRESIFEHTVLSLAFVQNGTIVMALLHVELGRGAERAKEMKHRIAGSQETGRIRIGNKTRRRGVRRLFRQEAGGGMKIGSTRSLKERLKKEKLFFFFFSLCLVVTL
jgi:hypothetical protein